MWTTIIEVVAKLFGRRESSGAADARLNFSTIVEKYDGLFNMLRQDNSFLRERLNRLEERGKAAETELILLRDKSVECENDRARLKDRVVSLEEHVRKCEAEIRSLRGEG